MDPVVSRFIEDVVVKRKFEWVQWSQNEHTSRSTIDRENGLLIRITFMHPSNCSPGGVGRNSNRHWKMPFDITKHTHWFSLRIEDPLFRWGRRLILKVEGRPDSDAYVLLKRVYQDLESVRAIPTERAFESRIVAVDKALKEINGKI